MLLLELVVEVSLLVPIGHDVVVVKMCQLLSPVATRQSFTTQVSQTSCDCNVSIDDSVGVLVIETSSRRESTLPRHDINVIFQLVTETFGKERHKPFGRTVSCNAWEWPSCVEGACDHDS